MMIGPGFGKRPMETYILSGMMAKGFIIPAVLIKVRLGNDKPRYRPKGDITQLLAENSDIWVVVVGGTGDCFSAGVDVSLIGNMVGQGEAAYRENLRHAQSFLDAFEALEKPTIADLQGAVIGGGMILALCCDFRIAAENVVFELPEVKRSIGVILGTQRITNTIGIAHTKDMVMLGILPSFGLLRQIYPPGLAINRTAV